MNDKTDILLCGKPLDQEAHDFLIKHRELVEKVYQAIIKNATIPLTIGYIGGLLDDVKGRFEDTPLNIEK